MRDGGIFPTLIANKLTGQRFDQRGAELFCLATKPAGEGDGSIAISIRLGAERVVVYAGKDDYAFSEVASFPSADFSGEPKLVRVGTMNLKAQARDHNGAAGAIGESPVFEIRSAPTPPNKDYFEFKTPAHRAMTSSPLTPRRPSEFWPFPERRTRKEFPRSHLGHRHPRLRLRPRLRKHNNSLRDSFVRVGKAV